jgi:hypothetical protein
VSAYRRVGEQRKRIGGSACRRLRKAASSFRDTMNREVADRPPRFDTNDPRHDLDPCFADPLLPHADTPTRRPADTLLPHADTPHADTCSFWRW